MPIRTGIFIELSSHLSVTPRAPSNRGDERPSTPAHSLIDQWGWMRRMVRVSKIDYILVDPVTGEFKNRSEPVIVTSKGRNNRLVDEIDCIKYLPRFE